MTPFEPSISYDVYASTYISQAIISHVHPIDYQQLLFPNYIIPVSNMYYHFYLIIATISKIKLPGNATKIYSIYTRLKFFVDCWYRHILLLHHISIPTAIFFK